MKQGGRAKVPMMVVSLALSLMLWLQVQSQTAPPEAPQPFSLPLRAENLDASLAVVQLPPTVIVRARGSRPSLDQVSGNTNQIDAVVDLSDASPGRRTYPVKVISPVPFRVTWLTEDLTVNAVLERVGTKEVPLVVETRGQLGASDLIFSGAEADRTSVRVAGPTSEVGKVAKARAMLNLQQVMSPGAVIAVKVEPLQANNRPVSDAVTTEPESVMVRPAVAPAPERKSVLVNAVFSGSPAFGYRVESYAVQPSQVFLTGKSEQLARVTTVETEALSLQGLKGDRSALVPVKLPPGTKMERDARVKVTVRVRRAPALPPSGP